MKKTFLVLSCCAILTGCGSNSERADGYDKAYSDAPTSDNTERGIAPAPSDAEVGIAPAPSDAGTDIATTTPSDAAAMAGTSASGASTDGSNAATQDDNFEEGKKLVASSDCLACHAIDKKLVGPAYIDVAKKYEATDKNIDYLANKIIAGGAGVWGQIPMTPHPDLSKEDASAMARYVLSLDNK